jgi:hypothetical protein
MFLRLLFVALTTWLYKKAVHASVSSAGSRNRGKTTAILLLDCSELPADFAKHETREAIQTFYKNLRGNIQTLTGVGSIIRALAVDGNPDKWLARYAVHQRSTLDADMLQSMKEIHKARSDFHTMIVGFDFGLNFPESILMRKYDPGSSIEPPSLTHGCAEAAVQILKSLDGNGKVDVLVFVKPLGFAASKIEINVVNLLVSHTKKAQ